MLNWFNSLQTREQRMLMLGALALIIFFLYQLVWQPVQQQVEIMGGQVEAQQQQFVELGSIIQKYKSLPAIKQTGQNNASLLSVVDSTSKKYGIRNAVKRLTPEGEGKVRVRLENVASDKSMIWLSTISRQYALKVDQIDINPAEGAGMVTICVILKR